MLRFACRSLPVTLLALILLGASAAAREGTRLVVEPASPQRIGTGVALQAVAPAGGEFEHRFSVARPRP